MRDWINLFEAITDKPWSRDNISKIADISQERFDALQPSMSIMGDLTDDEGKKYKVWGKRDAEEIRYYVGTLEDRCIGYILLRNITSDPKMFYVSMVFITPKFQRNGIGRKLYDFALRQGVTLVSDNTLTAKSKAIWQSMMNDPNIEVTFFEYDRYDPDQGQEKPLTNLRQAFSKKSRRMVARLKSMSKIDESYHDNDYDDEENGEQNIEKVSRSIIAKVKWFSRKLPINVEMRLYMNRYGGGCQGVVLTDLYATNPGDGAGTQVMSLMCQLADESGISLYTDAEGPRSKAFYEKFGFKKSETSGHMLQRHPPLPDWFTEE